MPYTPQGGEHIASPVTPTARMPGHYATAPVAPTDATTGQYAAPPPQYAPPATAQQFPTAPAPQYTAPYAPGAYGAPSPYGLPYFPDQTSAVPAASVLSVVAIVLAAFAVAISFFVSPLVPAAGAVVCASIGLRRRERLAKLALILGIVATVYALGILALNVLAYALL
ncbi:hypothetical protein HH310_13550 [Actinoplanes sp. TBRC 11911]|uniref:hypothetical protein n=1 Tax=Actinoplanes sp. TBRC 11911 TaxID=2729386 RepID=UPI00145E5164|nr:hypothetical protein [Actinoplanes sp. TBRC 11911]NMO52218.1 hypothetical protein [Actinoplanes sp. TBRC 11911]